MFATLRATVFDVLFVVSGFVVWCLLRYVCCALCVLCRLFMVACYSLHVVCCSLFDNCCLFYVVGCWLLCVWLVALVFVCCLASLVLLVV